MSQMGFRRQLRVGVLATAIAGLMSSASAGEALLGGLDSASSHQQFITKYREGAFTGLDKKKAVASSLFRIQAAVTRQLGKVGISHVRTLFGTTEVIRTSRALTQAETKTLLQAVAAEADVQYVEIDVVIKSDAFIPHVRKKEPEPMTFAEFVARLRGKQSTQQAQQKVQLPASLDKDYTNDEWSDRQWSLFKPGVGINVEGAWKKSTGKNAVVGVIDTGATPHPDLDYLDGYDFVSSDVSANDGDGPDDDPADDGYGKDGGHYHGAHVTGIVAARANNNEGIAGIAYDADVLAVRVAGLQGYPASDLIAALVWAAGYTESGVSAGTSNVPSPSKKPADVINLSLNFPQSDCDSKEGSTLKETFEKLLKHGTVIVASAGNLGRDLGSPDSSENSGPGACHDGIIVVAGTDDKGNRGDFENNWLVDLVGKTPDHLAPQTGAPSSNFGKRVDLAAPGQHILSTWGETEYYTYWELSGLEYIQKPDPFSSTGEKYVYLSGTSMAAPHVTGVVALMVSARREAGLSRLTPAEIKTILEETATPFPAGSDCTTSICGAGIVNAAQAVEKALAYGSADFSTQYPDYFQVGSSSSGATLWINSDGNLLFRSPDGRVDPAYTGNISSLMNRYFPSLFSPVNGFNPSIWLAASKVAGPSGYKKAGISVYTGATLWIDNLGSMVILDRNGRANDFSSYIGQNVAKYESFFPSNFLACNGFDFNQWRSANTTLPTWPYSNYTDTYTYFTIGTSSSGARMEVTGDSRARLVWGDGTIDPAYSQDISVFINAKDFFPSVFAPANGFVPQNWTASRSVKAPAGFAKIGWSSTGVTLWMNKAGSVLAIGWDGKTDPAYLGSIREYRFSSLIGPVFSPYRRFSASGWY
ncbi:MAG: S8 family serine peptidase [Azoarcus sp.]|nr:S8 family serine peptidase [Azoarcus sp.]